MIELDIMNDPELTDVLEYFVSALLPHENFDPSFYSVLLNNVFAYIHPEEMKMEYFAMFSALAQYDKYKVSLKDYVPRMQRGMFERLIEGSVYDLVQEPLVGMSEHLLSEGLSNNLTIETSLQKASEIMYTRSMELYDRCFERAVPSEEAQGMLPSYKAAFLKNAAGTGLNIQRDIINQGKRVGRRFYLGPEHWLEYIQSMGSTVNSRVNTEETDVIRVDSLAVTDRMFEDLKEMFVPLADYGIPLLDDETPMLKGRLVTTVGPEGVGKTTIMIDRIGRLLHARKVVAVMTGESAYNRVYVKIISNFIFHEFGKQVTEKHVIGLEEVPASIQQLINLAKTIIYENGLLIMVPSLPYDGLYAKLVEMYDEGHFAALFIDHSRALTNGIFGQNNVHNMSIDLRNFKRKYGVYINVLSHPSVAATEFIKKGKLVADGTGPTAESTTLSRESDELEIFTRNEAQDNQGLVQVQMYKRRGPRIRNPFVLKVFPEICHYVYDLKYQHLANQDSIAAEAALEQIQDQYKEEDEDSFEDGPEGGGEWV